MFGFYSSFIRLSGAIRLPVWARDRQTGRQAPDVDEGQNVRQKSGWGVNDRSSIPICRLFQGHADNDRPLYFLTYLLTVLDHCSEVLTEVFWK